MKAKLIWIEGKRADGPSFVPALRKKDLTIEVVSTGSAALARFDEIAPDLVVVNASSMRTSGKRICCDLRARQSNLPIVLILRAEQNMTEDVCANAVLKLPFTSRKLDNTIFPLLPGDSKMIFHAGPIHLDMEKRRVHCQGREAQLTPRLALLLKYLMQHTGEVIERKKLFCETWQTEYTGDTRTLDVHISWLREAIEENVRAPQFLKTIRGVGYRLDTEEAAPDDPQPPPHP